MNCCKTHLKGRDFYHPRTTADSRQGKLAQTDDAMVDKILIRRKTCSKAIIILIFGLF
jgi:hypothetical protein